MIDQNSRTISLNDIGVKYVEALQRLSDLAVFAWAGSRTLNEQAYDEVSRSVPGLPSTQFRLSFGAAREESERWMLKQSLNEVLGLCMMLLEDVRKLCGLVEFNAAKANASGNLANLAAELNAVSGRMDLPTRLKQLKDRYNVALPVEAELRSLAELAQCLFQGNATVATPGLTLRLKMICSPAEGETQPRLGDFERSWKAGEKVTLSRQEHAAVFTTISLLISSMLGAVQEYAKRSGLPEEPQKQ